MPKPKKAQVIGTAVTTTELAALFWTFAAYGTSWQLAMCVAIFTIINVLCACYEPPTPPKPAPAPIAPPAYWRGPFTQPDRERIFLDASEELIFGMYADEEREQVRRLLGQGDGVA